MNTTADFKPDDRVVYRPIAGLAERGIVTSTNAHNVFVCYGRPGTGSMATAPGLLEHALTDDDIDIGDHLWVLYDGRPMVVIKEAPDDYYVAGAWEAPFGFSQLTVISVIDVPAELVGMKPYYLF